MIDQTNATIHRIATAVEDWLFPKGKPLPEAKHAPPLPTARRAPPALPAWMDPPTIRPATLTPPRINTPDMSLDAEPTPPAKAQPRQTPSQQPPRAPPARKDRPMQPMKIDVAGAYESAAIARTEAGKLALAMGFRLKQNGKQKQIVLTTGGIRSHGTWRGAFDWLHACYLDRRKK